MTFPAKPVKEETTEEKIEEVRIKISDIDVVRMAFGPEWNAETVSDAARVRLGTIGRGVLQKELPEVFGIPTFVSRHPFPLNFTHPEEKVGVRKIRLSIAQILENDESLHQSMIRVTPIANFPRDLADEVYEEALEEMLPDPTNPKFKSYPDLSFLSFLTKARQGKLGATHPGFYAVLPMEAIHLAFWTDQRAETDMVPYKQIGPWEVTWTRMAMLELVLTAPPNLWPLTFKHAVAFDPSVALTVLKNSIWPEGWQPAKQDLLPLLVCSDSTVRSEAIQLVNALLQGGETLPDGEGAAISGVLGQKRRVPKKIGI